MRHDEISALQAENAQLRAENARLQAENAALRSALAAAEDRLRQQWRSGMARNLVLAFLALPVALVGPSRVYLGQHWPSDVLGAYLLGGVWLAGTIELHLVLKRRLGGWWSPPFPQPSRPAS